jgi:hypothetical protein
MLIQFYNEHKRITFEWNTVTNEMYDTKQDYVYNVDPKTLCFKDFYGQEFEIVTMNHWDKVNETKKTDYIILTTIVKSIAFSI